jgi:hypothetical protein
MALKIITLTIDENGDQEARADGYFGKGCDAALKVFGDALGTTTKVAHKPEFNKPAQHTNVLKH